MCIEAAKQAGVTAPSGSFRINSDYFHKRPKGCFKFPCSEDPNGICYFFNPIGNEPAKCSGTKLPDGSEPEVRLLSSKDENGSSLGLPLPRSASFEGDCLNSRHPNPRCARKRGSERQLRDHFAGIRWIRWIRWKRWRGKKGCFA